MSFANNFWGKEDAGVEPLLQRMHNAKQTCDELKSFYQGTFLYFGDNVSGAPELTLMKLVLPLRTSTHESYCPFLESH